MPLDDNRLGTSADDGSRLDINWNLTNPNPKSNSKPKSNPKSKLNLTLTQSLTLNKQKQKNKKNKKKSEILRDSNRKTLQPASLSYDNPTNCAKWKFVAKNVISRPFIVHHVNHETIPQFFSSKGVLGYGNKSLLYDLGRLATPICT